jgi:magnesium chelatase family protein
MLATARTFALLGVEALAVDAEVDINRGLPSFSLVGLPDAAVRESRERVRAAIANSGFDFPQKRITANLAPADLRKAGPGFDLAIAAAVLVASGQLPQGLLDQWSLAGELALDGSIRALPGVLAMAERAHGCGERGLAVPAANLAEARLVEDLRVAPACRLADLRQLAAGEIPAGQPEHDDGPLEPPSLPDFRDLRGQPALRTGLEVAAAGGHSALIVGPPGAGKSLGARRVPSILPPLERAEAVEVTRIASAAGLTRPGAGLAGRPFRAPHHTISPAGLVGGGSPPRPGEITLAHGGVLFLDEVAEFPRSALEALRQPIEDGRVTISRAGATLTFPARFQLIAAANPCPCGHGEGSEHCQCSPEQIRRYEARLSGPLADRIDVRLTVEQPAADALAGDPGEDSASIRGRVEAAHRRQVRRLGPGRRNASMDDRELGRLVRLDDAAEQTLRMGHRRYGLSGRGWARTLRVARTCADLRGRERVTADDVAAALSLRSRGSA